MIFFDKNPRNNNPKYTNYSENTIDDDYRLSYTTQKNNKDLETTCVIDNLIPGMEIFQNDQTVKTEDQSNKFSESKKILQKKNS